MDQARAPSAEPHQVGGAPNALKLANLGHFPTRPTSPGQLYENVKMRRRGRRVSSLQVTSRSPISPSTRGWVGSHIHACHLVGHELPPQQVPIRRPLYATALRRLLRPTPFAVAQRRLAFHRRRSEPYPSHSRKRMCCGPRQFPARPTSRAGAFAQEAASLTGSVGSTGASRGQTDGQDDHAEQDCLGNQSVCENLPASG